jgi:hypothetical protein
MPYTPNRVHWTRFRSIGIGFVLGEARFRLSEITDGFILYDRGEKVGKFATAQAARAVAEVRSPTKGVVHHNPGIY